MALHIHKKYKLKLFGVLTPAFLLIAGGGYLASLLLSASPAVPAVVQALDEWNAPVEKPMVGENRIYVPSIKQNIEFKTGGEDTLNNFSWWRHPERGNPVDGGNFILSGHRFSIGLTQAETTRKSPFFNIDHVQPGNHLYVDYEGKRYKYEIVERFQVEPTGVEIEDPVPMNDPDQHILTLYTCMIGGADEGRDVLIAKKVADDVHYTIEMEE